MKLQDNESTAAARTSLQMLWGREYGTVPESLRDYLTLDFIEALRADDCDAYEYRRRIGNGNLASYARTIRHNYE